MTTAEFAIRSLWSEGKTAEEIAEFCLFSDHAFAVDPSLIQSVREDLSIALGVPLDAVIVTGSARIGFSLIHGGEFIRGHRDLDVAIISEELIGRHVKEARSSTLGLSLFQAIPSAPLRGRRTATQASAALISGVREGVLDPTLLPEGHSLSGFLNVVANISQRVRHVFSDVSVLFYVSRSTLVRRQAARLRGFLATDAKSAGAGKSPSMLKPGQFDDCPAIYRLSDLRSIGPSPPRLVEVTLELIDELESLSELCKAQYVVAFPLGRDPEGQLEVDATVFYSADSCEDISTRFAGLAADLRKKRIFSRAFPATASGGMTASILLGLSFEMSRYYGRRTTDAAIIVSVDC